MFETYT